jgi:hypothetical protein
MERARDVPVSSRTLSVLETQILRKIGSLNYGISLRRPTAVHKVGSKSP